MARINARLHDGQFTSAAPLFTDRLPACDGLRRPAGVASPPGEL
ncbi:hypothetical protein MMEU_0748 [Mycobacterium marinum str. Europe]|nr:hypothetical protein MMEU_0748 [Mycobacterium marinum str. Europe]